MTIKKVVLWLSLSAVFNFFLPLFTSIQSCIHSGITVLGPRNTTIKARHLPAFMELMA